MKKMKKIVALIMATVMMMGMCTIAHAEEKAVIGSISISNPAADTKYEIYKMFDLETYSATDGVYVYKVTDAWRAFVTSDVIGSKYFDLYDVNNTVETTDDIYVKIAEKAPGVAYTSAELEVAAEDIAQAALAYAEANAIAPIRTLPLENPDNTTSYTTSGLELGYYLVDSSLGALCDLTTIAPNASIKEKNTIPTVEKEVLVDANHNGAEDEGENWSDRNDANIGDTIQYKTIVHAKKGAHDYIVHDRMGVGLTLNKDSIKVTVGNNDLVKDTDYTVAFDVVNAADHNVICDFEITFAQAWLDTITKDTDILITYSALLNENALIYEEANKNATQLDYGDNLSTEFDVTNTYTYMFDIVKTDESNKLIVGAQFKLYEDADCTQEIALIDIGNSNYHVATGNQIAAADFVKATITVNAKEMVVIKGLANGTYYLKEMVAPNGYNKLDTPVQVVIAGSNLKGSVTNTSYNPEATGNHAIQVINKAGTLLPETGGIGTTLFYVFGAILMCGAAIILVVRKRMSNEM